MSRGFLVGVAQTYAYQWLSWFVMTLILTLCVNAIWQVSLFEAADTILAIALTYVIVIFCLLAYLVASTLIQGAFSAALFYLVYSLFFALLPFSCVLAWRLYGWLDGHPLYNFSGQSLANFSGNPLDYENFSIIVQKYFSFWANVGHHIGSALGGVDGKIAGPGWLTRITRSENLPQWISALTAAISLFLPRQEKYT